MAHEPIDPNERETPIPMTENDDSNRLETGVPGLDTVLGGGLVPNRSYLIRGQPGGGKTTLCLQFLTADESDSSLYISFEENEEKVRANAASIDIDLGETAFLDLSPEAEIFAEDETYDIFAPSDVESESITDAIKGQVEARSPSRVVLDPVTQLRYLAPDEYQFRKQLLSFMTYLTTQDATVLFTSQATASSPDDDLQFMSDGTIELARSGRNRTISVSKFRGSSFEGGSHAVEFGRGGLVVYPTLTPEYFDRAFDMNVIPSGVPDIDTTLGGGIERGTVTIVSGPTGVGKTTLGTQFMKEAAGRGERSVIYLFEENEETFGHRSEQINIPIGDMVAGGNLVVEEIEAMTYSSEKFGHAVRTEVENEDTSIVMIDGVDGFKLSLRGSENELTRKLHSLCRYLKNMGVTVILVDEVQSVTGDFQATSENISYLADNIVFFRYVEMEGEIKKVIGVLKKRTSDFERTLREFEITKHGIRVGEPIDRVEGILAGNPSLGYREHDQ